MDKVTPKKAAFLKKKDNRKLAKLKTTPLLTFPRVHGKSGEIVNSGFEIAKAERNHYIEKAKSRDSHGNDKFYNKMTSDKFDENTKKLNDKEHDLYMKRQMAKTIKRNAEKKKNK
jgi:uncharacterized protein YaaW (UPF0174 family)